VKPTQAGYFLKKFTGFLWGGKLSAASEERQRVFPYKIRNELSPSASFHALLTVALHMQAKEQQQEGMSVLIIEGEIDLACSPELRALLHGFAKKKAPTLVLDFQGVGYVDSSGLATLVEYVRLAQDFGGKFGLLNVSDRVRTIFDLVRLTEFLPIYPSLAAARAALLAPPGA
jgi:anti-sigma B factor antagonist